MSVINDKIGGDLLHLDAILKYNLKNRVARFANIVDLSPSILVSDNNRLVGDLAVSNALIPTL